MDSINWKRTITGGLLAGLVMNIGEFAVEPRVRSVHDAPLLVLHDLAAGGDGPRCDCRGLGVL